MEQQETDPDSILNFYRKAIALRKSLSAIRNGKYTEYQKGSSKLYIYSRQDDKQKILVVCSFCDKKTSFRPPKGFDLTAAKLILQNYKETTTGSLQPYETRVYLWE